MKIVVADTGALISLGLVGHVDLIENVFGNFYVAPAVWKELQSYHNPEFDRHLLPFLEKRIIETKAKNYLSVIMDYGESESVILKAKQKGLIRELKPIFEKWLVHQRYFSVNLLNNILIQTGENPLER